MTAAISSGLRLTDFDYELPPERVARYPLDRRDQSRMLVMDRQSGAVSHRQFFELPEFLNAGDLVVVNNTRVLNARLWGHRQGHTGRVEVLLLYPSAENPLQWTCLMKPTRKLRPGTIIEFNGTTSTATVLGIDELVQGQVMLNLSDHPTVESLMNAVGQIPIPPYLNRDAEEKDKETYQTIYSKVPGSHAAPTAGLHFTPEVFETLKAKGVAVEEVTLSVSTGTFRNVNVDDITQHKMDPEHYTVPDSLVDAVARTRAQGGRVIAIGTTVAKTLESSAAKNGGQLRAESDWSRLFIYPGFQFQVADCLLTNFHLPRTTLMMLVSAFAGRDNILSAYEEAIRQEYRFFSYGDCMLIR